MRQPEFDTAQEVSEYLLRITADAMMQRDFETFAAVFALPHKMSTSSTEIVLEDRDALKIAFDQMCDYFVAQGVTALRRTSEAATFVTPDRVEATHLSEVLVGDRHLSPPYPVFSVLARIDGIWKVVSSDYALDDSSPQARALRAQMNSQDQAEAIYQAHLDWLSSALMSGDFEAFSQRIALPHRVTTETTIIEIASRKEMQSVFEDFAQTYKRFGMTDFVRIVTEAQFTADGEIIGTHTSHKMQNGKRLVPPYPNRVRLLRGTDGIWRETHCANAILNNTNNFNLWTQVADTPRLPDLDLAPERTPT